MTRRHREGREGEGRRAFEIAGEKEATRRQGRERGAIGAARAEIVGEGRGQQLGRYVGCIAENVDRPEGVEEGRGVRGRPGTAGAPEGPGPPPGKGLAR